MDLLNYRRVYTNPHAPGKSDDPSSSEHLSFLIAANRAWRQIDRELQKLLPAYLHPHFQTACLQNGRLIILADSNTAASRLKMLLPRMLPAVQQIADGISGIDIRLQPQNSAPPKTKTLALPDTAAGQLGQAAEALGHHPQLAAALQKLSARRQK